MGKLGINVMKFTFGIITGGNDKNLNIIVDSIEKQNIPEYEIIIVGDSNINRTNTKVITFDETIKKMWITRKKNIITENAKYENIVYMHDYIVLCDNWYEGFLEYGDYFSFCMNKIQNLDGSRYRDWTLWSYDCENLVSGLLIPYEMEHLSKLMYFSGSYWVAKKEMMFKYLLNDNLCWGEGEDVEWSYRVKKNNEFSMNKFSTVKLLKQKDKIFTFSSEKENLILNTISLDQIENLNGEEKLFDFFKKNNIKWNEIDNI